MQPLGVIGDVPWQELQSNGPIELRVVSPVDLAHAAPADPRDDAKAADGAAGQLVRRAVDDGVGHRLEGQVGLIVALRWRRSHPSGPGRVAILTRLTLQVRRRSTVLRRNPLDAV